MFSNEYGEAAVEVLDILDNTNKADVDKIPKNFIKFLVEIASEDYKVNLDHSKLISEMNLKEKTKEILGVIYINWWCDKKDKENYTKQIKELEVKRQEEIKEKYKNKDIGEIGEIVGNLVTELRSYDIDQNEKGLMRFFKRTKNKLEGIKINLFF